MDRRIFLWAGAGLSSALSPSQAAADAEATTEGYRLSGAYPPRLSPALRRVGRYAAKHRRIYGLPGMTLAAVGPDGLNARIALGYSDVERRRPVRSDQLFHIGSISKSFTAVMIHQLAAEGKLSLNDDIRTHLSGLPLPEGEGITLTHLLCHASGLAEDPPLFPDTPDGKLWVGFKPGSAWSYSNLGFYLLGRVVEEKDGRKLADSLKVRIFTPLGMNRAKGALYPADRALYAVGYAPSDPDATFDPTMALAPAPFETFTGGSGCVGADADDMSRWMNWLIGAGRGSGGGIMPDRQAAQFARPLIEAPGWAVKGAAYGSGLAYVPLEGRKVMHHTGGMLAFHSSIHVDPQAGVGIFASVNSGAGDYRPRDVTAYGCALLRAAFDANAGLDPKPAKVEWTKPAVVLQTTGADPEAMSLAGRYGSQGLNFGTVTLIAVKGGLAMPDGTTLEKTPEGYWRIKPPSPSSPPSAERMWFFNPVNGRPHTLSLSGARQERLEG